MQAVSKLKHYLVVFPENSEVKAILPADKRHISEELCGWHYLTALGILRAAKEQRYEG